MQNNVVQPNVNEVKQCQSTRTMPQPQQKNSFIFFHITVIQCPAVASIHDYISTKGGGGRGQCMTAALKKILKKEREREELRTRKEKKYSVSNKRKDTLHLIQEKILCI